MNDAAKIKTGTSLIKATKDGASLDSFIETTGSTTAAGMAVNTQLTARILWSSIFAKLSSTGDNSASFKGAFKIGVALDGATLAATDDQFTVNINFRSIKADGLSTDPTLAHTICPSTLAGGADAVAGEGVCGFNIKAGDNKVYIKDVYLPKSTWPNPPDFSTSGVPYTGARFFYTQTTISALDTKFCDINLSTASSSDLVINSDFGLPVNKIFNLENDKQYVFLAATVDKSRFSSNEFLKLEDSKTSYLHSGTPSEVVGLLDGKKCFVATAAYGSVMAPQVEWIRQFRNHFLLPHGWGRSFVRWYYDHSPPVAEYIAQHEPLRWAARGALWPVVVLSSLTVTYGFLPTLWFWVCWLRGSFLF